MNMDWGSFNPQENGNWWVPSTPEKPISQRSNNNVRPEAPRSGTENWSELLGIYSGFLQNERSNASFQAHIDQQNSNPIRLMGENYANANVRNISGPVPDHGLSQNVASCSVEEFFSTDRCRLLNQRANNNVLCGENTQPQKVDSLADLLSLKSADTHHPVSGLGTSRINYVMSGPTGFNESRRTNYVSVDESQRISYVSKGVMLNDRAAQHASHEMPNDRSMISYCSNYNPKLLPPQPEAPPSSSSIMATHFIPITPDLKKQQWKSSYPISDNKELHLSINDTRSPSREKHQENAVIILSPSQSPKVLENEQSKLLSVSAVQDASSPKEKNHDEGGGILEIDLNKTPQQKPPKRRKIRPKVVVEGKKPRKTPKKTPEENARPKRKYVRRKGVESPANETTNLVEESNEGPVRKSCRRALNFDLNVEAEKESRSGSDHHQVENYEDNQVPVDSNLLSDDAHCTREFLGSVEPIEGCQNTYRSGEQQTKKTDSQGSSQLAFTIPQQPTPPKNRTLMNIIAWSINVQHASVDIYDQDLSVTRVSDRGPNRRQPPLQIAPQLTKDVDVLEERGFTKGYYSQSDLRQYQDHALISTTQRWSNEVFETGRSGDDNVIFPTESPVIYQNSGSMYWEEKGQSSSRNKNAESNEVVARCLCTGSPQVHSSSKQVAQTMWSKPCKEQAVNSIIEVTCPRAAETSARNESTIFPDRVAVKKRSSGQARSKKVALMDKPVKKAAKRSKANRSKESFSLEEKNHTLSIDFITDRLRVLQISTSGKELVLKEEKALVPFEPVKKRIPRPRVELDSETNRLWNLLMGKEGSENAENMDADKQKWWEEERKVVRGRVDSFIARMHLVQGDRRFSKWKGSVVDSVIGVFLTQNVSDHLSSSAFMSLVSKFPAKSTNVTKACEKKHEVRITYPDGTYYDQKMTIQPESNHSSVTSIESSEHRTGEIVQDSTTFSNKNTDMPEEEDIVSSQGSTESCTIQNTEDVRSGSGSNSEADDGCGFRQSNGVLSISKQAEAIDAHQNHQFQFHSYLHKSVSYTDSWANMLMGLQDFDSREFINNRARSEHASNNIGQSIESNILCIQNGGLKNQQELGLHQDIIDDYQNRNDESAPAESSRIQSGSINNQRSSGHTASTQTEVGQVNASNEIPDKTRNTAPNTRKRKAEKEKAEPINWDALRKQAESDVGVRGRTYENMDSLDYEALRKADVREISDAIKERGMNNMLAERIKDFLNRLDRDHGKVELEWLRDVQPDKAKDYLLSIRGLGLKSVECVRLLTLHHLAFPVDTNVGRIAVRLGWVPLQPLPESLQLHLLELYPVLESIQKYLWPRLCKLDQETLYELHYQMITFGKVFCTKRDPNCNVCPMRAECRHFASAFASARLALPAPEERRVVSSSGPIKSDVNGPSVLKNSPMLLTPAEDKNSETRTGCSRNCEPLIEEPTTPEQPIEFSEGDIEDLFCEDPEEIPVIKLNVEEFAANLHSFMQENMELGEADVSKALVALSPGLASSIPAPKLKNISRLRTEHQVYELPDSHPLLKEMDKREPDDPSPYLLAIWTPGETADSVTPPEITCSSREGDGACNNETCFSCNSAREAQAQTVRGTILIPCRTAMRGSFPLNGTYFQVNEVFADHDSSLNPIDVPRSLLWNLPRRTVYFGTSVSTIFKGMSTENIQICFWKGFVCVRGFDQKTRAPRPLRARLHFPASKMVKKNE